MRAALFSHESFGNGLPVGVDSRQYREVSAYLLCECRRGSSLPFEVLPVDGRRRAHLLGTVISDAHVYAVPPSKGVEGFRGSVTGEQDVVVAVGDGVWYYVTA